MENSSTIKVGVIGYGYWGPNIVRNFHAQPGSHVVAVCDEDSKAMKRVQQSYPGMVVTSDCQNLLRAPDIDAIAVVTPVRTHYELAKAALENGKHVFVEKPFTCTSAEAEELLRQLFPHTGEAYLAGVTGAPGTGKSTLAKSSRTHFSLPTTYRVNCIWAFLLPPVLIVKVRWPSGRLSFLFRIGRRSGRDNHTLV